MPQSCEIVTSQSVDGSIPPSPVYNSPQASQICLKKVGQGKRPAHQTKCCYSHSWLY